MNVYKLKEKTCCGIVLFNPDVQVLKRNVEALYEQIDSFVLIDNCSQNRADIEHLISDYNSEKITYIVNEENYGIARALNQILQFAEDRGYQWYLTMDQDSKCCVNLIEEYSKIINSVDNIGILCPFILNNNKITFDEYKNMELPSFEFVKEPIMCITSGCLNQVKAAKEIGGYHEELFIDYVDGEFNILMLKNGYKIVRANSAYMYQTMGKGREIFLFCKMYQITGKKFFRSLQVSPVYANNRLYYIARNSKYLRKRYGKDAVKRMTACWMFGQIMYYFLTYPKERSRIQMLKSVMMGLHDSKGIEGNNEN